MIRLALLAIVLLALFSSTAVAQSDQQLLIELLRRVELLERELRQLRGDFEDYRYRAGGGAAVAAPPPAFEAPRASPESYDTTTVPPPPPPPAAEVALPRLRLVSPSDAPTVDPTAMPNLGSSVGAGAQSGNFDSAYELLRQGAYSEATAALEAFLASAPAQDPQRADALYWLGVAHYTQRHYTRAREIFINYGSRYPQHRYVPDTLLYLGLVFEAEGNSERARQVYSQLQERYPDSRAARRAQGR